MSEHDSPDQQSGGSSQGGTQKPSSGPAGEDPGSEKPAEAASPKKGRFSLMYVAVAIALAILLSQVFDYTGSEASYDQFLWHVEQGHVRWVELGDEYHRGFIMIPEGAPKRPAWDAPASESGDGESGDGEFGGSESGGSESGDGDSGDGDSGDGDSGDSDSGGSESGGSEFGDSDSGGSESGDKDGDSAAGGGDAGGEARRRQRRIVGDRLPEKGEFEFRVASIVRQDSLDSLKDLLKAHGVRFWYRPTGGFWPVMLYTLPFLIIVAFWFLLMRQSGQMGRAAMTFGRSRAKLQGDLQEVDFGDVAGCEEAIEELTEVVDFLRSPKKYQKLGGRIPRGILLVGPPGTGKTLLARAVAGESKVPFFTLSGSDFVEMFVGVGAARVRDLFQQAKSKAPCIVFVDELDAVGRHRGAGLGGGHDEREQTLNQLLVEMDGFDPTKGVIFLAATNRPDVLDPALLRPGRFDRQIVIDAPDAKGREAILRVHAAEKPFADEVDFARLARATPGFTGADLANVINEAALLAARRGKSEIDQADLQEAGERVIAGPERKSRRLGDTERERVAYHECGHALVAALTENSDPVRKISIIPRGHAALGYTMQTPDEDRFLTTKGSLLDKLKSLLAGRASEIIVYGEPSTGAANDLERATQIARAMVCRFGMSDELGPVSFGRERSQVFLGRDFTQEERDYSEHSAQRIDKEVRRILDAAAAEAIDLLRSRRDCLDRMARVLLEKEVLQGEELDRLLECQLASDGAEAPAEARKAKAARGHSAQPG